MISDKQFAEQYTLHSKIIECACKKYVNVLPDDEFEGCKLRGLYNAIENYDSSRKMKFSSYVYSCVRWECLRMIRFISRGEKTGICFDNIIDEKEEKSDHIKDLIFSASEDDMSLLVDRFYGNMTLAELGKKHNLSYESIRTKIGKIIEELQF